MDYTEEQGYVKHMATDLNLVYAAQYAKTKLYVNGKLNLHKKERCTGRVRDASGGGAT
jgi:hypothetical protein